MDEIMKAAQAAGARLMHTEDQHEVISFRPEALAAFVAGERERLAIMVGNMFAWTGGHGEPRPPGLPEILAAIRRGSP